MPIRQIPFDQLAAFHFSDLVARGAREDETLEFKRVLVLDSVSDRVDLLQDVAAMANTSGGTIVYGAEEGEGEDRGVLVSLRGARLSPDETQQRVTNLLRDGLDEALHGVRHGAVQLEDGTYLYVIRIPASPLAPHRVTLKESRWRYYSRSGTSNNPMNARQVKEVALRAQTAVDRVRQRIEMRADDTRRHATLALGSDDRPETVDRSGILLHLIPLYAMDGQVDLADEGVANRLKETLPHGSPYIGNLRWTLEGLYTQHDTSGRRDRWALVMRDGALEFGQIGLLSYGHWVPSQPFLDIVEFEGSVRRSVAQARLLSQHGWPSVPFVLSLRLLDVEGTCLGTVRNLSFGNQRRFTGCDLMVEPEVVVDWTMGLEVALRRVFNTMWQAYGFPRSTLPVDNGTSG